MHSNKRLVWKSIESVTRLGLLSKVYSDSKIIFILRHPCGQIASYLKGQKRGYIPWHGANNLDIGVWNLRLNTIIAKKHGLTKDKLLKMPKEQELAWQWVVDNDFALEELNECPNAYILNYDLLCSDPLNIAKDVFKFCELNWDRQSEQFVEKSTSSKKSNYFSVYKNPKISTSKWSSQFNLEQIEDIMNIVSKSEAGKLFATSKAQLNN